MEDWEVYSTAGKLIHRWNCEHEAQCDFQMEPDYTGEFPAPTGIEFLRQYVEANKDELALMEENEREVLVKMRTALANPDSGLAAAFSKYADARYEKET